MSHKRDDAASIVGDELADELEQRNQRLVGRSAPAVAPGALVIKGKKSPEEKPPMDEDEMEGEEMDEDEEEMSYRSRLGGATTLDAAESFLQKSQQSPLMDSWSLLADVLANVAATTSSGDLPTVIRATVGDFQKRLDVLALRAIVDVNRLLKGGTPMSEAKPNTQAPEPHVLDESIAALKSAFDDALANHASITERGEVIQPALEQLAQAIRTGVEVPADGNFNMTELAGVIKSAVAETVAPLQSQVHALMQRSATNGGHVQVDTGQRRAIQLAPLQERGAPVLTAGDGKTPKLREIINRSVRQ